MRDVDNLTPLSRDRPQMPDGGAISCQASRRTSARPEARTDGGEGSPTPIAPPATLARQPAGTLARVLHQVFSIPRPRRAGTKLRVRGC
jgi:hypothetical protein